MDLYLVDFESYETLIIPGSTIDVVEDALAHSYFIGSSGTLGLTETDSNPVERSYSDGVVFPPEIRRKGRDYTLDILFTDLGNKNVTGYDLMDSYREVEEFVRYSEIGVAASSDNGYVFQSVSQCQRIEITKNDLEKSKKIMIARLYMKGGN